MKYWRSSIGSLSLWLVHPFRITASETVGQDLWQFLHGFHGVVFFLLLDLPFMEGVPEVGRLWKEYRKDTTLSLACTLFPHHTALAST